MREFEHMNFVSWSLLVTLLLLPLHAPKNAFASGSPVAVYAGLSLGLQKTYKLSHKEDDIEVSHRVLRTLVLPPQKFMEREVIPVKVIDKSLSRQYNLNRNFIDYLLLTADQLLLLGTKYTDEKEIQVKNKIILQSPLNSGTAWATGAYEKTVAAANDSIQVPAGVYSNCLKIITTRKIAGQLVYEETAWYAPEVGEIKNVITYPLEGTAITTELLAVNHRSKGGR
jgi:hypothetical protein